MASMLPETWQPKLYLQFEDERTRPARDLLAQVRLDDPALVVDVGCGPGNSTELLAARWPDAKVQGIDTSETMLAEARQRVPGATFVRADAARWLPGPGTRLVYGNAVYQWLPDHLEVLPRVLSALEPEAVLAVQMPDNLAEPTHLLMSEVAGRMPFAEKLTDTARRPLPPPSTYYEALAQHARKVDIWHTVYNHVLAGPDAIVDWVRGTGLNPFLQRLDAEEKPVYLAAYRKAIAEAYPTLPDGKVLLRFPRLFIVAER